MDAVTYSEDTVISFIDNHLIPLRVRSDEKPLSTDFTIAWTPALIILDAQAKEHQRKVGFISPEGLIPSLWLGIAKLYFDNEQLEESLTCLEKILASYPKSKASPEALFYHGVCRYKKTDDPAPLKETYQKLHDQYPESEWSEHSLPYRLV